MVLVYLEHTNGKFKKSGLEAASYAAAVSGMLQDQCTAIVLGAVANDELMLLGKYGVSKVLHCHNNRLDNFNSQAYAQVIAAAATQSNAKVVIMSNSFSGKGLAPRVAIRLKAGLVDGAIALPETQNGFTIRKGAYSGKAYANVNIISDIKVISLSANCYKIEEKNTDCSVEDFNPAISENALSMGVRETVRASDKVSLPEAELVVSAGRGLKGPENWGMIEELASLLGAATACSKPVSDAHWRPHSEHVGQTGIAVSPNLYIAIGISGAIQHLAGVSSSKTIVVINKDSEAPFFKAADYGIVGDAFEVIPRLIESVKKFKAANA
ncbi:MAG: electron transfer flavoprotein subunit alpha/FixB family protein [Bacteroidetes bacterium]|nr:electron transfer flavoprotein subunit alpha/FixB family protein [Bacteroidota bacterium]